VVTLVSRRSRCARRSSTGCDAAAGFETLALRAALLNRLLCRR
jgi:hypothetical protein